MGGFFGVVAQQGCVSDVFYGTDYHSHMGTVRGGMAFYAGNTFHRSIHNIQNAQFRARFERAATRFAGLNPNYGIGVISDQDDQPILVRSHLGMYTLAFVGLVTNLSEIVRTGTPVNSAVNLEVLGTIFYEGTPLHDGAAIIENGRIKAAGCVLPLSNNLDLGKDMGTRHRACLGIAENSDAIAIVVSEETGIISMAKNGVLIRHFDRQTLYTRLVDEMIPKETASEKSAAEGWKARGKRLLNWVNAKEEEEQQ